jgi:hypothetical protein
MGSVATGRTRGRSPRPAPRTLHQLPRALRLSIGVPSFTGFHPLREVSLRQANRMGFRLPSDASTAAHRHRLQVCSWCRSQQPGRVAAVRVLPRSCQQIAATG